MKKKLFSILLSLAMVITMMPAMTMTSFAANSGEVGYVFYTDAEGKNPSDGESGKYFKFTVTNATPKEVSVAKANENISGECTIPSSVSDGANFYSVTSIGDRGFQTCRNLTSVTIPEGVKSIDEAAFQSCSKLTSVTIPSSVTSIGEKAFQYCTILRTITVNSTNPPTIGQSALGYIETVYVPHGYKTAYVTAWAHNYYDDIIDGYYVKIDEPFKNIISADPTYVEAIGYEANSKDIILTVTPVDGYQLKDGSLKVTYDTDKTITPTATQNARKYTFKMPAADVTVTAELSIWPDLSNAFKGEGVRENNFFTVSDDASTGVRTITLMQNITAGESDSAFVVPQGKNVVLDLNGYSLNRGLQEATANGAVIYVEGDLTIKDTSANHGKITGGYSSNPGGGGICVRKGSLTLENGQIANNKSVHAGGGVFIADNAKFTMSGGKITRNHTDNAGGGVFCLDNFTMTGGEISNNESTLNGAGVYAQGISAGSRPATKHFTMTGGTIKNNVSSRNGGGVYVDNYDMDALLLGGQITENKAASLGGGVCANDDITLGGSIKIIDNKVKEKLNNVFLRNKEKSSYNPVIVISANAPLESGANIGVTLQTGLGTIAETETDISSYFVLDATGEKPVYDSSSIQLVSRTATVTTIDELRAAIAFADTSNENTIVLDEDIYEDQQIQITDGKKIILDLKGHKLKRIYNVGDNPSMIYVDPSSSLTIMDSSDDEKGEICSGDAQYGAAIRNDGTLVLESGTINDCHARKVASSDGFGGAVYNFGNNAKFTMTGGAIKNCDALQYGGAIHNFGGTVTINGGTIENCEVTNDSNKKDKAGLGGAIWNNNALTISGGTIQNCKSAYAGGAIFNDGRKETLGKGRGSVFTMTGGTIKDCGSASEDAENKPNTEIIYLRNSKMSMSNSAEIVGGIYTNNKSMETSEPACQIDITGGKFNGSFSTTPSATNCAISITGGQFTIDPTSYVASGYKVNSITDSTYKFEVVKDNGGGGGGNTDEPTPGEPTNVDVTKEVTVEKTETGETTAIVDVSKKATDIVTEAKEKQSKEVIIDAVAKTTEEVDKADVIIPAKLFEDLSKVPSVENITVQTNVAELTFDKETAKEIAAQSPDGAVITVEAIREDEESTKLSQDVYELKVVAKTATGEQIISNFKGGKVTVKVDIPAGLSGKKVACLYRSDKGVYTRRTVTKQDDTQGWFSFTTNHFSDYVVTEESTAQKLLVNQVKPTQNKLKAYKHKKIRVSFKRATWDKELDKKISDYQVYRSTKKSKGFKKVATLKKKTSSTIKYFNKKGLKKGKKYYYKVRGRVKLSNGKYAYTKWSSVRSVRCK